MEMTLQGGQYLQMVVYTADLKKCESSKWFYDSVIFWGVCLYSVPRERAYTCSLDYLTHCWLKWEVNVAWVGIHTEELEEEEEAALKAFL